MHFLLRICLFFFFSIGQIQAQIIYAPSLLQRNGAVSLSKADANLFLKDSWSAVNAIANISKIENPTFGMTHQWTNQLLSLSTIGFSSVIPLKKITLSAVIQRFGDADFNEQNLSIGIGHSMGIIRLGGSLQLYQVGGDFLRRLSTVTFNLGINTVLSNNLEMSFHAHNVFNEGYEINEQDKVLIPSLYSLGINYKVDDKLNLTSQVEKESYQSVISRVSISYQLSEYLVLHSGVALLPLKMALGFSVLLNKWKIDYGVQVHQILPWSHAFSLSYEIEKS